MRCALVAVVVGAVVLGGCGRMGTSEASRVIAGWCEQHRGDLDEAVGVLVEHGSEPERLAGTHALVRCDVHRAVRLFP